MVTAPRRPDREAGYNLVFLIVLVGMLGVAAAATLPALKQQLQREKEAELIFRGLQYAEGIRVFQQRFGRYPNTLEELIELEPRSMRQLYPDPMTDNGRWALVLASAAGQVGGGDEEEETDAQGRDLARATAPRDSFRLRREAQPVAGPILGVVSRKKGQALRTFLGKSSYQDWRFTPNILPKPQVIPGTEVVVRGNVDDLGKPFPMGLEPQGFGNLTGDTELTRGSAPDDLFAGPGDDG